MSYRHISSCNLILKSVLNGQFYLVIYLRLGIDDAESECGLDTGISWDIVVQNDDDKQVFNKQVEDIVACVNEIVNR